MGPLEHTADALFGLILGKTDDTASGERIESDGWLEDMNHLSFDVRMVDVPDTARIIMWLWMNRIEESEYGSPSAQMSSSTTSLAQFTVALVVWLLGVVLGVFWL